MFQEQKFVHSWGQFTVPLKSNLTVNRVDQASRLESHNFWGWSLAFRGSIQTVTERHTAPHAQALINGANFWTAMWLYNIFFQKTKIFSHKDLASGSSIIKTWHSRLSPNISKLEPFAPCVVSLKNNKLLIYKNKFPEWWLTRAYKERKSPVG